MESHSSDSDAHYKQRQQKKLWKKLRRDHKRRKLETTDACPRYVKTDTDSDTEDDLPLSSFGNKRRRPKLWKHKSHTITSSSKERRKKRKCEISDERLGEDGAIASSTRFEVCTPPIADQNLREESKVVLKNETRSVSGNDSNSSDDSLYKECKPNVKSKIRDPRNDHKAGPSSGRLRNILKKEHSSNLWYSRPCTFDSDTSEN